MIEFEFHRILLAFFCGYFLSLSGSLSQLTTNNGLASPSTLGMDGLGVIAVIISQLGIHFFDLSIELEHFSFFIFSTSVFLVFFLQKLRKKKLKQSLWDTIDMKGIVLAGLAFNLFVGAIFSIVQFLFMTLNYEFPSGIWFGNLRLYQDSFIYLFSVCFILTFYSIKRFSSDFEVLSLGSSFALGLKIPVARLQSIALVVSLFLTGLVISYFGVFSFLGLIFPHILRSLPIFKLNMRYELIYGPVICGVFLSVIDFLCFNFTLYGAELPVGMVFSVLGAFMLIALIFRARIFST